MSSEDISKGCQYNADVIRHLPGIISKSDIVMKQAGGVFAGSVDSGLGSVNF
jgi:hypothetical protein